MALNLYNLEIQLAQKMQYAATDEELLFYSKTMELIRNNAITVVSTFVELPAVTASIAGELYFVQADQLLYIPVISLGIWRTLITSFVSSVWAWGRNYGGQLGDNTTVNKSSPVSVVGAWTYVSAGTSNFSTAAITNNGTIWTWGNNNCGQLGDNTIIAKSSPVSIVGGFTNWCHISASGYHTAAIQTNGTIWTWGNNNCGQLGDNTIIAKSSPVSIVGGVTNWCQVSAGSSHTTAVSTNGTLWSWGRNQSGQLGDNTTASRSSPVSVVGGFTDWCNVSAGQDFTTAIRTNGTLWTWGSNSDNRLGNNTAVTASKSSPVSVVGGFTDWCQVSAGQSHAIAIRTTGSIWTWGNNGAGRLGDNTAITKSSPVSVVGGFTDWCQVSAGSSHTAAVRTNGTLWTWGFGQYGRLGNNTIVNNSSPVSVVGGFTDWCQVSAGYHTAAIRLLKTF